jgi:hypothetical protein
MKLAFEFFGAHSIVGTEPNDCPRAHICVHKNRTMNAWYVQ